MQQRFHFSHHRNVSRNIALARPPVRGYFVERTGTAAAPWSVLAFFSTAAAAHAFANEQRVSGRLPRGVHVRVVPANR